MGSIPDALDFHFEISETYCREHEGMFAQEVLDWVTRVIAVRESRPNRRKTKMKGVYRGEVDTVG